MTEEKKMTKKETEEALAATQSDLQAVVAAYNQLQAEHGRRLMYLRLLEQFTNNVDAQLAQVKRDIAEINASLMEQPEGSGEQPDASTGEEI